MCPVDRGRRPNDDFTARARIRDAAIELFGEHGYRGTSIREVAKRAGVSGGLVQHHFGSKDALREACDGYVLEQLRATMEKKIDRDVYDASFVSELYAASDPIMKYTARGLSEEWPGAARLFDVATEETGRWLTGMWPERFPAKSERLRRHAATLVCMSLGTIVLHGHLGRWVGGDPLAPGQQQRTGLAVMEICTVAGEFLATERGRVMRQSVIEYDEGLSREKEHTR
jgi:TetR/AcrR family transcriptional regulator, regulator of cefoperazone and chloramphenicol sensitivity